MLEGLILGVVQGVAEWLPVSSEGFIFLTKIYFFSGDNFSNLIRLALFLHLGTFLAALVYFWSDVKNIVRSIFYYKQSSGKDKKLLTFLLGATTISGVVGIVLIKISEKVLNFNSGVGGVITVLIGVLLLITAGLQFKKREGGQKDIRELSYVDTVMLGVTQGFAVLPGLSRSGLTVATLLLRRFNDEISLRLSFLMSLPVVLVANIVLNFNLFKTLQIELLLSLTASFIFGLLTIHGLLAFAKKVNFGLFILFFGLLMILAGLFT